MGQKYPYRTFMCLVMFHLGKWVPIVIPNHLENKWLDIIQLGLKKLSGNTQAKADMSPIDSSPDFPALAYTSIYLVQREVAFAEMSGRICKLGYQIIH